MNCYTNGGALFRLFNGSWNRNHISRVNECMEKLKSTSNVSQAKKLLKNLYDEMNKTSSFNPKGALMDILYYLDWKIQYNTIPLDLEIEKPACCMLL